MTARRLIVSGDDLGAAPEINTAVIRAHRDGILTATSLMVTGAAAAEAVALARGCPRLAVGLHLVLVQGQPAAPAATIPHLVASDGAFHRQPVLTGVRHAWTWLSARGRDELRSEIEAQLSAFAATGLPLAHVDGHLNMHLHPMVLPLLVELAPRWGIRAVRLSREALAPALRHDPRHLLRKVAEGTVFGALAAWAAPRLAHAGIATADRVYGLHQTGHVDERYLLQLIGSLPPGVSELYCHPAERAPAALRTEQPGYEHARELSALLSPQVRSALREARVELCSYADLTAQPARRAGAHHP